MVTPEELKEAIVNNYLTKSRRAVVAFVRSYLRNSPYFDYQEDPLRGNIVVIDDSANLSKLKEDVDRIVLVRGQVNNQEILVDRRYDEDLTTGTYSVVKPHNGVISLFCESRNKNMAEFIASKIETAFILGNKFLSAVGVLAFAPTVSDITNARSGPGFNSMAVSIPITMITSEELSIKKPDLLEKVEADLSVTEEKNVGIDVEKP